MALPSILTSQQIKNFDTPPKFTLQDRYFFFKNEAFLDQTLANLKSPTSKVGFVLQYGYFKAAKKFFSGKNFKNLDINHVCKKLSLSSKKIDFSNYSSRVYTHHKKLILQHFDWQPFKERFLKDHSVESINSLPEGFYQAIEFLHRNKVEIPGYRTLAPLVSKPFNKLENNLIEIIKNYPNLKVFKPLNIILERLTTAKGFKQMTQSVKPFAIQESLQDFKVFKEGFDNLEELVHQLNLTPASIEYYATWVHKSETFQLNQFASKHKLYLYLIAFVHYQYYSRQDALIDIFLKSVQASINAARAYQYKIHAALREEQYQATNKIVKTSLSAHKLLYQIKEFVGLETLSYKEKVELITAILTDWHGDEELLTKQVNNLTKIEKKSNWYKALESQSIRLQRRVNEVLKVLEFNPLTSSDSDLLKAIDHFKICEGNITSTAPMGFLKDVERKEVTKEDGFRVSLYKILLFINVAEGIKSGKLNLKQSYRYKSLEEYMIERETWENEGETILKDTDLQEFKDFNGVALNLNNILSNKYKSVNRSLKNNPYLSLDVEGKPKLNTPNVENNDTEYVSSILKENGEVSLYQVLSTGEELTGFSKAFKHHSLKYSKMKPTFENLSAGIMGIGLNHGISQMAQMSKGISEKALRNMINWFFSLPNIEKAYGTFANHIGGLSLNKAYEFKENELVTGSDGRKIPITVDSLNSSYSYKYPYFGKIGVHYTFLDEKHRLMYSTILSSTEREAAYVIDGLLHNDAIKSTIHSTDTHGYTEIIFAILYFMGISFAPRFKKIKNQHIYSFDPRKEYVKKGYRILPCKRINIKLIEENWDDILRFMATIKSKHTPASQLLKRLSSYAKDNPLYKALKEFGRIIKSTYILTYFEDVELRQLVQKTLNQVEHSNKFAKAISFANNQELQYATKEEQQIALGCTTLIQNAIVFWNYLHVSQKIVDTKDPKEQQKMINLISKGSLLCWGHLNFHGEYNFNKKMLKQNIFDMDKINKLKIKK